MKRLQVRQVGDRRSPENHCLITISRGNDHYSYWTVTEERPRHESSCATVRGGCFDDARSHPDVSQHRACAGRYSRLPQPIRQPARVRAADVAAATAWLCWTVDDGGRTVSARRTAGTRRGDHPRRWLRG